MEFDFFNTVNRYFDNKKEGQKEIELFLDLCKSQYFGDGNKRTAQIMMCGLLIKEGYAPFTVNFKEPELSQALVDFYDDEDKKEIILNLLIERQNEITKDFLTPNEMEEFLKQTSSEKKKKDDFEY